MRSSLLTGCVCGLLFAGCASTQTAKDFKMVSFEDTPTASKPIGNVEGKDCMWSVFGWPTGPQPTVRTAFQNAAQRKSGTFIPGQELKSEGSLKSVRNVSVENDFLSAYIVARQCVVITGMGYQ